MCNIVSVVGMELVPNRTFAGRDAPHQIPICLLLLEGCLPQLLHSSKHLTQHLGHKSCTKWRFHQMSCHIKNMAAAALLSLNAQSYPHNRRNPLTQGSSHLFLRRPTYTNKDPSERRIKHMTYMHRHMGWQHLLDMAAGTNRAKLAIAVVGDLLEAITRSCFPEKNGEQELIWSVKSIVTPWGKVTPYRTHQNSVLWSASRIGTS